VLMALGLCTGTAACDSPTTEWVTPDSNEAARADLYNRLAKAGFTNITTVVETETDEIPMPGQPATTSKAGNRPTPRTSATPRKPGTKPASPKPRTSTVTYTILSATFDIPGTLCRANVEQRLEPFGPPDFDEVILPDGQEKEVSAGSRNILDVHGVTDYVTARYPVCTFSVGPAPTS